MKKIRLNSYLEKAKELDIKPFEISYSVSKSISVSVFNGEIEQQEIGNETALSARGIYDGKVGLYSIDSINKDSVDELVNGVFSSSKYGKEESEDSFFDGKGKYKKVKIDQKEFKEADLSSLRECALQICKEVQSRDKRIEKCEVGLSVSEGLHQKENSLGLKVSSNRNYLTGYVSIVCSLNGDIRSSDIVFHSFKDVDDLKNECYKKIDKLISASVDFFNSKSIKSKEYPVIFSPSSVSSLLSYYVDQLSAKNVLQHLSVFEGKLNTQVTSKKLTITHTPFEKSTSASSYDSEGVPTTEFPVIKNGVLLSYFHSLETSKKMNEKDNGCGSGNGQASYISLSVKESKKSIEEGFLKIKNGLYITEISGLNSGINSQTLQFSLPCQGYHIKDGKKEEAVSMILISGDLQELFSNVKEVYSDKEESGGIFTPSLLSKVAVSGNN